MRNQARFGQWRLHFLGHDELSKEQPQDPHKLGQWEFFLGKNSRPFLPRFDESDLRIRMKSAKRSLQQWDVNRGRRIQR